jgi:hypothetical protein
LQQVKPRVMAFRFVCVCIGLDAVMRRVTLGKLFSESELKKVSEICNKHEHPHDELTKFVRKRIARINKETEQENLPEYIAYLLEWQWRMQHPGQ